MSSYASVTTEYQTFMARLVAIKSLADFETSPSFNCWVRRMNNVRKIYVMSTVIKRCTAFFLLELMNECTRWSKYIDIYLKFVYVFMRRPCECWHRAGIFLIDGHQEMDERDLKLVCLKRQSIMRAIWDELRHFLKNVSDQFGWVPAGNYLYLFLGEFFNEEWSLFSVTRPLATILIESNKQTIN